jgi:hypothetical protein
VTITTSSIGAAIDYLVSACTSTFGDDALVFDGVPSSGTELTLADRIWIGFSPANPELPVAVGEQEFATLGARSRNETSAIVCAVEHADGSTAMQPVRDGAFALLRTVETLLRGTGGDPGDTTLGGAVLFSGIGSGIEVYQAQDSNGASVLIQFHVQCTARLTAS